MGANTSSSAQATTTAEGSRDELDAVVSDPIEHQVTMATRHKYLLSLDRSMKAFLRASNLPGLEYRLRLAGYHTFHDLLKADQQTLEDKGFTGIMAQRLLRAISNYLRRQLSRRQEERLPFQLVRRGQKIKTEPSESLKENPNYRKRNVKRQKSLGEESARRGTSGSLLQSVPVPRLMAESDLQLQHLLSPPPARTTGANTFSDETPREEASRITTDDVEARGENEEEDPVITEMHAANGNGDAPASPEVTNSREQVILGVIVKEDDALLVVEESSAPGDDLPFSDIDDDMLREEALHSLNEIHPPPITNNSDPPRVEVEETDYQIRRSYSIPANLKLMTRHHHSEDFVFCRIRAFSCTTIATPQPMKFSNGQHTI